MAPTKITLVPHTHWDREWYEPFSFFSRRLVEMMDTLIGLGTRGFPHFHLDGQTAMIDDFLAIRPGNEADVRRLAAEGRVSVGPWVTQMDEFLTSGESHIRNLEMGLARARELGPPLEIGYMPDQFGHIGQMPQILRMQGVERAVVWRGVPTTIDKDVFWWESPDSSRVLTEYMAFGYFTGGPFHEIEDPRELAEAIGRSVERLSRFAASDRILVMVGYDHAGPDPTLPERVEAAKEHLEGIDVEVGGLAGHVASQRLNEDLPVWRGELRSSARAHLLPNVYSARVHQKRERGRVEALIERYAEPLATLVPGFEWPEEQLRRAWTLLLWNGAHDSACGCSHDQVALDVDRRFAEARTIGQDIAGRALAVLGRRMSQHGVVTWNPSILERDGVPGLGWRMGPAGVGDEPVVFSEGPDGEVVADEVSFTLLDEPDVGDLYNYCWAEEGQEPVRPEEIRVAAQTVTARFDTGLSVRIRITHHEGEPFLRLDGTIENRRPDHRLRLHVRLPELVDRAIAGSPFELVQRPLSSEGSDLEAPSPTWPARGFVIAGATAVLHQGVFEYEIAHGSEIAVTLLRCVATISRTSLATRPFAAGPDVKTPLAQMMGHTEFSLGVWPGAKRDALLENWERFALPLVSAPAAGGGHLPPTGSLLNVSGGAELSSVRRRNDRVEVRVWNPHSDRAVDVMVADRPATLPPGKIETIVVEQPQLD